MPSLRRVLQGQGVCESLPTRTMPLQCENVHNLERILVLLVVAEKKVPIVPREPLLPCQFVVAA